MPQEPGRRVVTVLFLDLVGSTAIASDLGDHRWRHLLSTFLRTVRSQLKRYGGHEEDTTGDGLFATFDAPDNAIRCAEAIATSVHELGLEVRCGLHAGGVETIDGKLGGIAVHIGARVMSLGGPAEVLVTSTVRDLVAGSRIGFEDVSAHELKGVPGTWQIYAVSEIDGVAVSPPLEAAEAAARIDATQTGSTRRRRRRALAIGATALVVVTVLALVSASVLRAGPTTTLIPMTPRPGTS